MQKYCCSKNTRTSPHHHRLRTPGDWLMLQNKHDNHINPEDAIINFNQFVTNIKIGFSGVKCVFN